LVASLGTGERGDWSGEWSPEQQDNEDASFLLFLLPSLSIRDPHGPHRLRKRSRDGKRCDSSRSSSWALL